MTTQVHGGRVDGSRSQYPRAAPTAAADGRDATGGRPTPVVVTVLSDDPLSADGMIAYLTTLPGVRYVPPEKLESADVVLVVAVTVSDSMLAKMEAAGKAAPGGRRRVLVLVADSVSDRHLARVFGSGVVSILPRRTVTREVIGQAVTKSRTHGAVLPEHAIRWLVDQNRDSGEILRSVHGITVGGLTLRETDVLRLLAEGKSTAEVARELNFAERTIKNIIRELLERHHFLNRTQAVAYAIRVGAI